MKRRPMHRDAIAALAIWCFSLQGLALSILLTALKFRADTFCDEDLLAACPLAATTSCATVLGDAWATVFSVPLTVYSSAFYLVTAVLALLTVCGAETRRLTRPVLLVFAHVGLLVALALAARATLVLGALCPYCLFLDIVQLGLLVAARLMYPDGLRGAWQQFRGTAKPDRTRLLGFAALAVLALVTVASVQRTLLRKAARDTLQRDLSPCEVRLNQVPESPLTLPAPDAEPPRLIAAVFLDLACPHCRDEFEFWPRFQATAPWPIEIRIYHFPATSCDLDALASGAPDLSLQRSCDAARALHCLIELGDPGRAMAMTEALFAAQDRPTPYFSASHLAAVAREFGVDADPTRRSEDDPLFGCMDAPETTDALVRDMRFAQHVADLDRPPGALLIPLLPNSQQQALPFGRAQQVRGHKPQATLEAWISALLADVPERP